MRCLYHYSQERLVVYSLAIQLREWGNLIKGPGAYELPKVVECSTANFFFFTCTDVEM